MTRRWAEPQFARVPAKRGEFSAPAPRPAAEPSAGTPRLGMAQLRLTDFFGRTKAAVSLPAKHGARGLKAALVAPPEPRNHGAVSPPPASPRTPTRSAAPAVPRMAGRKRSRREMEAETPGGERGGKSARKRLELPRDAGPEVGGGGGGRESGAPSSTRCLIWGVTMVLK